MQLPRRVPWASLAELEQVCSWIYENENDRESKILAVNRLSAWRAVTYLPHALESTLSLLVVLLQDDYTNSCSPILAIRQSYATAIIRLVNGLVDPLQLGAYARSIASIANQLNFPSWLVEIRHAATHEDLPSIELLREAARESMSWLLHNYFLPTLNPSSTPISQPQLRPLVPILQRYKTVSKITARDASLKPKYKDPIFSIIKDVERWISEAKVAANVVAGDLGWEGSNEYPAQINAKEKWALNQLCDALIKRSALVPLAKKKRVFPDHSFYPPKFSVLLWSPFLHSIQNLHPDFVSVLTRHILSSLMADTDIDLSRSDQSYDACLARWTMWLINTWESKNLESAAGLRKEVITNLTQSLGRMDAGLWKRKKAAMDLLEVLCVGVPQLEALFFALQILPANTMAESWIAEDLSVMQERLTLLRTSDCSMQMKTMLEPAGTELTDDMTDITDTEPDSKWQVLTESDGWQPRPIGVHYNGGVRPESDYDVLST